MIQVNNFSKFYNTRENAFSVKNVSFKALSGQITGLLGLNGAGKSTILKAIMARHYPSEGEILVSSGNDLSCAYNTIENPVEVKKITGYVPERPEFSGNFSVYETLQMQCWALGIKKENLRNLILDFELDSLLTQKIKNLSKGELQRFSLAFALINNPSVLVLDEVTSGLDVMQARDIRKKIKELSKNKTILISTHNMSEAEELCSNICILQTGKLKCSGTIKEILSKTGAENLEQAFIKGNEA